VFDTKLTLRAALSAGLLLAAASISVAAPDSAKPAAKKAPSASATKPAPPKKSATGANKPKMIAPATAAKAGTATPVDTVKSFLQAQKSGDDIKAYSYFSTNSRQQKTLKEWLDQAHQVRQSFSAITMVAGEALLIASDYGAKASPQEAKIAPPQVKGDTAVVQMTRMIPITTTLYLKKENGQWLVDMQKSLAGGKEPEKPVAEVKPTTPPAPPTDVKPVTAPPPSAPDTTPQVLGNMRQIFTAFQVYALDHGGRLPDASKWTDELMPYLSNQSILKNPPDSPAACGFAMNSSISGQLLKDVASDRILLYETSTSDKNVSGMGQTLPSNPSHTLGYLLLTVGGDSKTDPQRPSIH
jgi:hypothetical protein